MEPWGFESEDRVVKAAIEVDSGRSLSAQDPNPSCRPMHYNLKGPST